MNDGRLRRFLVLGLLLIVLLVGLVLLFPGPDYHVICYSGGEVVYEGRLTRQRQAWRDESGAAVTLPGDCVWTEVLDE